MAIFYAPNIESTLTLPEEESLHCARVLRMQVGEELEVIDGVGGRYQCRITNAHAKHTEVEILAKELVAPLPYGVHIAIAPTKNMDRIEWMVEKATEIGLTEITPLLCRYSERKNINLERIEKILVSATKQSKHVYLPLLHEMTPINTFIEKNKDDARYIAHCYEQDKKDLFQVCPKYKKVVVMIGPEGDFCEEELELAFAHQFQPVTLGPSRLRTETAGLVAAHIINLHNH